MAVRDSNGNELKEGDSVQVIKDLKVGGSSLTLKEEEVECREGRSVLVLKTCFLKKS